MLPLALAVFLFIGNQNEVAYGKYTAHVDLRSQSLLG